MYLEDIGIFGTEDGDELDQYREKYMGLVYYKVVYEMLISVKTHLI